MRRCEADVRLEEWPYVARCSEEAVAAYIPEDPPHDIYSNTIFLCSQHYEEEKERKRLRG